MPISAKRFADEGAHISAAQERAFFGSIKLANQTFKATGDHRLDDLNALVIAEMKKLGAVPASALDVAVSSGISTAEWSDALAAAGYTTEIVGTDLWLEARLVTLSRNLQVLIDEDGVILQTLIFGMPVRPWLRRLDFLTGYWALSRLGTAWARTRLAQRSDSQRLANKVMLISPRARKRKEIRFECDDLLTLLKRPNPTRFDIVRAANILNNGYFSDAELERGVTNLGTRLNGVGALLVICRTRADESNHGSLFRLNENGRLDVVARLGEGSEIEGIVLANVPITDLRKNVSAQAS